MANWAIVIGVDKYWLPKNCLRGAVKDALRMRRWLLDENGGDVPRANLLLLLSPDKAQPPAGLTWIPAEADKFIIAIEDLLLRSEFSGERFFFHFSGHGLTARNNFSNQQAIVPSDFTETLTDKALTVRSLFELFQATRFKEQYFFIDACRNLPFETEKRLRDYPNPRTPQLSVSPQFIMLATQPGAKAVEITQPGDERGAFTDALLRGLQQGAGAAKRWDERAGRYVVRWNSLFEFVERDVTSRKLVVATTADGTLIQAPSQSYGERRSQNPQLASFAPDGFAAEELAVDLRPRELSTIAEIAVGEMAGIPADGRKPPLPGLPVTFHLPPRSYGVRAAAPGYTTRQRYVDVDLYQPTQVEVELVVAPAGPPPPPQVPPAPPPPGSGAQPLGPPSPAPLSPGPPSLDSMHLKGFSVPAAREPDGRIGLSSLTLQSLDSLAYLELTDSSGRILAKGRSPLGCSDLPPDFYRARLVSPDGDVTETLVGLLAGSHEEHTVGAAPPTDPLLQDIVSRAGFEIHPDKTVSVSETVGPSASLRFSTVLALAAAASSELDSAYGLKLKALGMRSFQDLAGRDCTNGIQVVVGDEWGNPRRWQNAELHCWPLDRSSPEGYQALVGEPRLTAVATAAICRDPGAYWLWLRLPNAVDLRTPVVVLPDRVSLLVVTFDLYGAAELHQYALALPHGPSAPGPNGRDRFLDPVFGESRFAAMRRIELMQRSVAIARITPILPDVDKLLEDKWIDPIAGCLAGYLLVRMGRAADLRVPVGNLCTFFAELPDAHVLRGAYLEQAPAEGNPTSAYVEALGRGLPIFRDGLELLDAAIERLKIRHEGTAQLRSMRASVPAGSLWSATSGAMAGAVVLEPALPLFDTEPALLDAAAFEPLKRRPEPSIRDLRKAAALRANSSSRAGARGPSIDSKFRFVLVAARRAEQLMRGAKAKGLWGPRVAPTRVAMEEVAAGLVEWGYGPAPAEEESAATAEIGGRRGEAAWETQIPGEEYHQGPSANAESF